MSFLVRALSAWLAILGLAFLNGGFREVILIPRIGEGRGHLVSTLLLCALVLGAAWFLVPWVRPEMVQNAWVVGVLWVALTLAFEFLAGHYLFGNSWERLLADYNVLGGRIWVLVLVTTLVAPVVVYTVRSSA